MSFVCLAVIIVIAACSKASEDKLSTGLPGNCDTVNRKYSIHVVPILEENCYSCHGTLTNSNSDGIILQKKVRKLHGLFHPHATVAEKTPVRFE